VDNQREKDDAVEEFMEDTVKPKEKKKKKRKEGMVDNFSFISRINININIRFAIFPQRLI